MIKENLYQ